MTEPDDITPRPDPPGRDAHNPVLDVVVAIPCLNEGRAIAGVIAGIREHLPHARVVVVDNGSDDDTVEKALAAGAEIVHEPRRGKGRAVSRILASTTFDVLLMIDGDGTYDASSAPRLVEEIVANGYHHAVAARSHEAVTQDRAGHRMGNAMFSTTMRGVFGASVGDPFSGFRALSRPFADVFPAESEGFQIETELTAHALTLDIPWMEFPSRYIPRNDEVDDSKLRTFRDGWRILRSVVRLWRVTRPFLLFGILAALVALVGLVLGLSVVPEYLRTGLVPRFPTAILSGFLVTLGVILMLVGLLMDVTVSQTRHVLRAQFLRSSREWNADLRRRGVGVAGAERPGSAVSRPGAPEGASSAARRG